MVAGPALRVGRGGRIVVSSDGGDTWEPAGRGIDVPMPDMVELFVPAPDGTVWAICSGGGLLRAAPAMVVVVGAPAGRRGQRQVGRVSLSQLPSWFGSSTSNCTSSP